MAYQSDSSSSSQQRELFKGPCILQDLSSAVQHLLDRMTEVDGLPCLDVEAAGPTLVISLSCASTSTRATLA